MKLLTLIQAGCLLLLAVIGAYAGQEDRLPACTSQNILDRCDL